MLPLAPSGWGTCIPQWSLSGLELTQRHGRASARQSLASTGPIKLGNLHPAVDAFSGFELPRLHGRASASQSLASTGPIRLPLATQWLRFVVRNSACGIGAQQHITSLLPMAKGISGIDFGQKTIGFSIKGYKRQVCKLHGGYPPRQCGPLKNRNQKNQKTHMDQKKVRKRPPDQKLNPISQNWAEKRPPSTQTIN